MTHFIAIVLTAILGCILAAGCQSGGAPTPGVLMAGAPVRFGRASYLAYQRGPILTVRADTTTNDHHAVRGFLAYDQAPRFYFCEITTRPPHPVFEMFLRAQVEVSLRREAPLTSVLVVDADGEHQVPVTQTTTYPADAHWQLPPEQGRREGGSHQ